MIFISSNSSSTEARPIIISMEKKPLTWVQALPTYVHYLMNGNLKEVQHASIELRRMAEAADNNTK